MSSYGCRRECRPMRPRCAGTCLLTYSSERLEWTEHTEGVRQRSASRKGCMMAKVTRLLISMKFQVSDCSALLSHTIRATSTNITAVLYRCTTRVAARAPYRGALCRFVAGSSCRTRAHGEYRRVDRMLTFVQQRWLLYFRVFLRFSL